MKFNSYISFLIITYTALFLFSGCKKQENISALISDSTPPGPVSNVRVTNTPGGVIINYTIPQDADVLYVQATYKLADGIEKSVNSSFNKNHLQIEGFADTKEYSVQLVAVDKSGNKSNPVNVSFTPLTPPIQLIEESFKLNADFGGVNYTWYNQLKTPVALLLFYKDSTGAERLIDTYYSDQIDGNFTLRGQDTTQKEYSVVLRDKWGNLSDRISKTISPLYEVLLDRTKYRDMGATYRFNMTDGSLSALWDNNRENNSTGGTTIPWNAAFDMGVNAKLSRIVIWQYSWSFNNYGHYYAGGNARVIEIYGSNAPTPSNVIDESWTLIKTSEIIKVSNLPIGIGRTMMSDEDYDIARNRGHEFVVPLDKEPFRYIMVRVTKGWESTLGSFSEIQIYGQPRR